MKRIEIRGNVIQDHLFVAIATTDGYIETHRESFHGADLMGGIEKRMRYSKEKIKKGFTFPATLRKEDAEKNAARFIGQIEIKRVPILGRKKDYWFGGVETTILYY